MCIRLKQGLVILLVALLGKIPMSELDRQASSVLLEGDPSALHSPISALISDPSGPSGLLAQVMS